MRALSKIGSSQSTSGDRHLQPGAGRVQKARQLALLTAVLLGAVFVAAKDTRFLMPGPLTSAHSAIEQCQTCHAASGSTQVSWLNRFFVAEPHGDSKACLTCHDMPQTALNPHGAAEAVLKASHDRLLKVGAQTPVPVAARMRSLLFPADGLKSGVVQCAACHQEHQGAGFNLTAVADEQCQACHTVKFDSFEGHHPDFEGYPFQRRTRIAYDHAGHFGKHYPELQKKDPAKTIPATCATCHSAGADRRVMAVAPFEATCSQCHLGQIMGEERASGPKGIAFLSLPGLDVVSLKKKGVEIGEWPEESEAALTPFTRVLIGRSERGAALISRLDGLNLTDLAQASDSQIQDVKSLVWEIKGLFHGLLSGKASDLLAGLQIGSSPPLGEAMLSDLTANLPQDVILSLQRQWLPNLAKEMAARPDTAERPRNGEHRTLRDQRTRVLAFVQSRASTARTRSLQLVQSESGGGHAADQPFNRRKLPSGTPRSIEALEKEPEGSGAERASRSTTGAPGHDDASGGGAAKDGRADGSAPIAADVPADTNPQDQSDDLLKPTAAEMDEIKAREKGGGSAVSPSGATAKSETETSSTPAAAIVQQDSAVPDVPDQLEANNGPEPEDWADTGGWYHQDHAIYYRLAGHKDKFVYSWLSLTGPAAPAGANSPASAVFDALTGKDAQGSCSKCHSVDTRPEGGRTVNFSPLTGDKKRGRFTRFIHEPHFGLMPERGCLTCHQLEKGRTPLKSYEQGDPGVFSSNFGAVNKETCQSCHTSTMARQDCSLCHTYHVNGVATAIMKTKIPTP